MTAQQHAAAAGEVVAAAGAVSAVATLEAVEAAAAVSCFFGRIGEESGATVVRGAAIVLHSLGERGGGGGAGEIQRSRRKEEGGRYTRKGEIDKRRERMKATAGAASVARLQTARAESSGDTDTVREGARPEVPSRSAPSLPTRLLLAGPPSVRIKVRTTIA